MTAIKRDDIASIHSLDDLVTIFKEKGFTEYKKESDTEIRIKISDEPTFLSIFQINGVADVPKHQKYLDVRTEYLTLVTHDFENFIFVKKEFTKLDTERFRKFRINKSKITNTSLNKINGLIFNDLTSFDNLFDRKEVVKQFYDEFIKYRKLLIDNISGLTTEIEKERYAQILVDRLIFLYFIQKKELLDENENYLPAKLKEYPGDFFNKFLCPLFFKGLSVKGFRDKRFGDIPYLNGGLFRQKKCEQVKISIPDEVFDTILTFFDSWSWYVDERADFGEEKSISPEILGHIFEKTVNQKESGAYYTPELITSYISETTIYPVCVNKVNSKFKQNYSTIKELFEKNSPDELSFLYNEVLKKLSVLDNACGSGAFLIAAQDVLIDIYSQTIFRLKSDSAFIKEIQEHNQNHELKLNLNLASAQEFHDNPLWSYYIKRMIITNNLYGVDIEEGAGEIGKLRLWLSMIADVPNDISLVEPLPNIEYNIRCGNSLIGFTSAAQSVDDKDLSKKSKKKVVWNTLSGSQISLDTYQPDSIFHLYHDRNQLIHQYKQADDSKNSSDLKDAIDQKTYEYNRVLNKKLFEEVTFEKGIEITEEAFANLKPFHWIMEFSEIFERGGFDIVVGNPPYVRQELIRDQKGLFKVFYPTVYQGTADLYTYFIERSMNFLRPNGMFSYIVANKWMRTNFGKPLRRYLKTKQIVEIIDFADLPIFQDVITYPCIIRIVNNEPKKNLFATKVQTLEFSNLEQYVEQNRFSIDYNSLSEDSWTLADEISDKLLKKIQSKGIPLNDYISGNVFRGIVTGLNKAFVIDENLRIRLIKDDPKSDEIIKPFVVGKDIKRYKKPENLGKYVIFTRHGIDIKKYPAVFEHLKQFKTELMPKPKDWKGPWAGRKSGLYEWYEIQDTIDYFAEFEKPKICYPNICQKPEFSFDSKYYYMNQKCFIIPLKDEYLLGILNSKLNFFLFKSFLPKLMGKFFEPSWVVFKNFPIYKPNLKNVGDKQHYKDMIDLVSQMLDLHKNLKDGSDEENNKIQMRIEEIDHAINSIVYELYGLTKNEIEIIENALSVRNR